MKIETFSFRVTEHMTNVDCTTYEILPNELWLSIFQYFNTYNIFYTFFKLNKRIDSLIVNENNLHVALYNDFDYEWCTEIFLQSINSFSQVKSLTLANSRLLEQFHEIYPIYNFTQLHTLKFLCPVKLTLFHDVLCMTTLKSFSFVYNNASNFEAQWKSLCYNQSNLTSTLTHLTIKFDRYNTISDSDEMVNTNSKTVVQPNCIERLIIRYLSNKSRITILPLFGQTQFLTLGLFCDYPLPLMTTKPFILNNCIKMELDLYKDITYQQIESILKLVPHIKYLSIIQEDYPVQEAGRHWQYLLENICKNVLKFRLLIRFTKGYGSPEYHLSYWNQDTFRTLYWFERKTKTKYLDHAFPGFVVNFDIRKKNSI
ncbi:unnamed protein product [Adineta steineri]|uniref:F-box domain-containing protein n=1 Tax=Adineta steineri TaxID=433720 RepID=A0A815GLT3_9BILA|nr:unnamed protein product [Adineta steineri]